MSSIAVTAITTNSGETEDALRYRSIVQAVRIINTSKNQVDKEEALGCTISPAWRLLDHAAKYLMKEATVVLRGEGTD